MTYAYLSDADLFAKAVSTSNAARYWRAQAKKSSQSLTAAGLSRPKCLAKARFFEGFVVDMAIVAEQRCIRKARA